MYQGVPQLQKLGFDNSFGENINDIIQSTNMSKLHNLLLHHVTYEVILHVKMLGLVVMDWILCQLDGTLVVIK